MTFVPVGIVADQNWGVTIWNVVPVFVYCKGPTIPSTPITADFTKVIPIGIEIESVGAVVGAISDVVLVSTVVPSPVSSVSHDNALVVPAGQ
jgi:hypothetical protein